MKISVNCNNSIKLEGSRIIYIDPFKIQKETHDADYIFCTHSHYDHFSAKDIKKILKENSKIITVESALEDALKLVKKENLIIVQPDNKYVVDNIEFYTSYAYNVEKTFHPISNKWVGFVINLDGTKYYIAGDTDNIKEIQNIKADFAFIPVGGTYTMNYDQAAKLANTIKVDTVIPTHYGSVAGEKEDGEKFKKLVKNKQVLILLKE